nr:flagellar filament capping protein FliD [Candidatus Cloacimonadota bacterium]
TAQSYHLVLTGKDSGADYQINMSSSTLSNIDASDFETTREATNAMVKIDDYPSDSDSWIQKSNNLITDLIPDASISLKTSGTTSFSISNDTETMADKVEAFVDAYNEALSYINSITKVVLDEDSEAVIDKGGILVGNYGVNIVKTRLKTFIGQRANGFDSVNDDISLLTQVGITTGSDNLIDFDREAFMQQLNENPDDVINLFSADNMGVTDNATFNYASGLSTTKAGEYEIEATFNDNDLSFVKYRKKGDSTWYTSTGNKDIKISEDKSYFTIFNGDARGVMINTANGGTGTQTTVMNIKEGKSRTFDNDMDILLDDDTGTTKVLTKNYESIIENIDKRIVRENMRLEQIKSRLTERFGRLEASMQELQGQMSRLQSQIASMTS